MLYAKIAHTLTKAARMAESTLVLGTMSGTSCDGFDVALCRIGAGGGHVELLDIRQVDYPERWMNALQHIGECTSAEAIKVEAEWSVWVAKALKTCLEDWKSKHGTPQLIGFSGHTLFHEPGGRGTAAIGDASMLARTLKVPVVADYRSADVAAGGQGAPLVPLFDAQAFGAYGSCVNLGGIANATVLPPEAPQVRAWDLVGCNLLLNRQAGRMGLAYDANGMCAAQGQVDAAAKGRLDQWAYLQRTPPKSLAAEDLSELHDILDGIASPQDALCTAVEWMAQVIGSSLALGPSGGRVLLTGGGAHNGVLVGRIAHFLPEGWTVEVPDAAWVDGKEAAAFAWLAWRTAAGLPTSLASVTGANRDVCGGRVFGNFAPQQEGSDPRSTE